MVLTTIGDDGMRVVDLFAGIGGFTVAAERAGMTTVLQVENDPACRKVLRHHWPTIRRIFDVHQLRGEWIRDIDLICGGFPCQGLSIAGRRAGLDDPRSGLWYEYARILEEARPRWCVIENVPGLLSSNGGRDMGAILGTLADLGYGYAYRVLDAQWFRLAQRRKRVFIVGCAGTGGWRRAGAVLFDSESSSGDPPTRSKERKVPAALTGDGVGTCGADDNQAQAGHLIPFRRTHVRTSMEDADGWSKAEVSGSLLSEPLNGLQGHAITVRMREGCDGGGKGPLVSEDQSLTLGGSNDQTLLTSTQVRRLTPRECERLQGFSDDHTAPDGPGIYLRTPTGRWKCVGGTPDSQRYKQLGNAVAVPVVGWILRRLREVDDGSRSL